MTSIREDFCRRSSGTEVAAQRAMRVAWSSFAVTLLACASVDGSASTAGGRVDGKADDDREGIEAVEWGPLDLHAPWMQPAGTSRAYRVESYGGMELAVHLEAEDPGDAAIGVHLEGPLPGFGDDVAAGRGGWVPVEPAAITLTDAGVYRVIVDASADVTITAQCRAGCGRPSVPLAEVIAALAAAGALDVIEAQMGTLAARLYPEPEEQAAAIARFSAALEAPADASLDDLVVIPLSFPRRLRPALGLLPDEPTAEPPAAIEVTLEEALSTCSADRGPPAPLHAAVPEVGYGYFPDRALTRCQVSHSAAIAELLNALARGDGSTVSVAGTRAESPRELFELLLATGHAVEMRDERFNTDVLTLTLDEGELVVPALLDTGLVLDGEPLVVPAGHSQHAFRIDGPLLRARVMFYLGLKGARFFPQVSKPPDRFGHRVAFRAQSELGETDVILDALDVAALYFRRIEHERSTVARSYPLEGYGYLGVCNDSTAVLELATRGTITTFPLLRALELDEPPSDDRLGALLAALPHDADVAATEDDVLRRIAAMLPEGTVPPALARRFE